MKKHYDIDEIKSRLGIASLFERDGHDLRRSGGSLVTLCPFHGEKTPSCHINEQGNSFHCYGCGTGGDILAYWMESRGVNFQQSLTDLATLAGVSSQPHTPAKVRKKRRNRKKAVPLPKPLTGDKLAAWLAANDALLQSPGEQKRIAQWRGYSAGLVRWATEQGLIGLYPYFGIPREAFLVEMPTPSLTEVNHGDNQSLVPVSVHIRLAANTRGNEHDKQAWHFQPKQCGAWPFMVGNHTTAKYLFITEGQWDALALINLMGWYKGNWPENVAVIGLRGSSSGDKLITHYRLREDAMAIAFADADNAGSSWFFKPCRQCPRHPKNALPVTDHSAPVSSCKDCKQRIPSFLEQLQQKVARVFGLQASRPGADFNDLVREGSVTREDITSFIRSRLVTHRCKPTGPTFLQWCRRNKEHSNPDIAAAALHVTGDPGKPRGRKPFHTWLDHWQQTSPDLIPRLQQAWDTWKHETTSSAH